MANRLTMQMLMAMLVLGLTTGAWADDLVGAGAGQPVESYAMSLEQAQQPNPAQETMALQKAAMSRQPEYDIFNNRPHLCPCPQEAGQSPSTQ